MTSAVTLNALEHEIQEKRQRLAQDLERLRSPETMSRVKTEQWGQAVETKDHLLGSARDELSTRMKEIWQEAKDRAAANPAAELDHAACCSPAEGLIRRAVARAGDDLGTLPRCVAAVTFGRPFPRRGDAPGLRRRQRSTQAT